MTASNTTTMMNISNEHFKEKVTLGNKRTKIVHNWTEFPYRSIIAISGLDMDEARWSDRNEAPEFYGVVGNPDHFDGNEAETIDENDEYMVTFVLNGHYKWLDSDLLNVMSYKYRNDTLQIVSYPPPNNKQSRFSGKKGPMRDFEKTDGRWTIINHRDSCLTCASPWYRYKNNKETVDNIIEEQKNR